MSCQTELVESGARSIQCWLSVLQQQGRSCLVTNVAERSSSTSEVTRRDEVSSETGSEKHMIGNKD